MQALVFGQDFQAIFIDFSLCGMVDAGHWVCTGLELAGFTALLAFQGVFRRRRCPVDCWELKERVVKRFGATPAHWDI